ncbi:MAG: GNAT family N-acetyltransferase [Sphingobacterium sp.]
MMEIEIKDDGSKGFAVAKQQEKQAGKMTYSIAGAELIIIDSTEVDPLYSGKGVGKQLLYKIVEMARSSNIKIIPLCPFAATMFKKDADIKDVLK